MAAPFPDRVGRGNFWRSAPPVCRCAFKFFRETPGSTLFDMGNNGRTGSIVWTMEATQQRRQKMATRHAISRSKPRHRLTFIRQVCGTIRAFPPFRQRYAFAQPMEFCGFTLATSCSLPCWRA